tara:strand:- start:866 stop:1342 length:477 start_codon:yes stop_codon:yes gene_type:complete
MATSTLIQFLDSSTGVTAATSNRRQVETFLAGGAITAGDWVFFDVSQTGADRVLYIVQSPASGAIPVQSGMAIGVALDSGVAGDKIDVVVGGYHAAANCDAGIAIGATVTQGTVAGRCAPSEYVETGVPANYASPTPIGLTLGAVVANVGPVWVYKRF